MNTLTTMEQTSQSEIYTHPLNELQDSQKKFGEFVYDLFLNQTNGEMPVQQEVIEEKYGEENEKVPVRLTPENAKEFIGCTIFFQTRGEKVIKKIIRVAASGRSITIDHPDLNNNLVITTRKVYVM